MVWYSHLFKNFPQFVVIHTVKGFSVVNEAEVDVFSGILWLFPMIQLLNQLFLLPSFLQLSNMEWNEKRT